MSDTNMLVKDIKQLKRLASDEYGFDCYILLQYGLKSSKYIQYDPNNDIWYIFNLIDDSEERYLSTIEFEKNSFIYEALKKKVLKYQEQSW